MKTSIWWIEFQFSWLKWSNFIEFISLKFLIKFSISMNIFTFNDNSYFILILFWFEDILKLLIFFKCSVVFNFSEISSFI